MNIEKQVCSLEQAMKLKELGVKQESNFWHLFFNNVARNMQGYWQLRYGNQTNTFEKYSAFTVAELGVMIGTWMDNESEPLPDFLIDKYGHSLSIVFNPLFLADLLIYLIEYWRITATEVNNRLKEAAWER